MSLVFLLFFHFVYLISAILFTTEFQQFFLFYLSKAKMFWTPCNTFIPICKTSLSFSLSRTRTRKLNTHTLSLSLSLSHSLSVSLQLSFNTCFFLIWTKFLTLLENYFLYLLSCCCCCCCCCPSQQPFKFCRSQIETKMWNMFWPNRSFHLACF